MFICNVSLYTEDALKEVNLVRHTTSTPSISSTTPASYASLEQTTPAYSHILPSNRDVAGAYGHHQGMGGYGQGNPAGMGYEMQSNPYQGVYSPLFFSFPFLSSMGTAVLTRQNSRLRKRLRRPRALALRRIRPASSTTSWTLRRAAARSLRPSSVWRHVGCFGRRRTHATRTHVGFRSRSPRRSTAPGHVYAEPDWQPGVQRVQTHGYKRQDWHLVRDAGFERED